MTSETRPVVVTGTGTFLDGAERFGPAEFEAERGETFVAFMERLASEPVPEGEPATFFAEVRGR